MPPHPAGRASWKFPVRAITRNVSRQGTCIYTMMPLREAQKLMVRKGDIPGGLVLGTVRWIKKINDKTYTAGIHFPLPLETRQTAGPAIPGNGGPLGTGN